MFSRKMSCVSRTSKVITSFIVPSSRAPEHVLPPSHGSFVDPEYQGIHELPGRQGNPLYDMHFLFHQVLGETQFYSKGVCLRRHVPVRCFSATVSRKASFL